MLLFTNFWVRFQVSYDWIGANNNYSIIFRSLTYDEFIKAKNYKKRHPDPETRRMTLLDPASNKIKDFRDPEIVDTEINSGPGLGLQIGAFYKIITYGIAMNIDQVVSPLIFSN